MKAPFISVRFSHSLVRLYTAHDINRILHYATGKVESRTIKARKEARSLPLPAQINRCVYIEEDEGSSHETFTRESRGASLIELFVRRRKQRWEPSSQRVTLPAYWLSNNSLSSCFFFFLISSQLTFYSSSPLRHRPPVRQHPNPEKKIQFSLITSISIFFDKNSKDIHSMDFIRCFPGYGRKERR